MDLKIRWKDVLSLDEGEDYVHPYFKITYLKLLGPSGPAGDDYLIEGDFLYYEDFEKWVAELTDVKLNFKDYINHYYEYDENHHLAITYEDWVDRCLRDYSDEDITHEDRSTCRLLKELESSAYQIEVLLN